MHEDAAHILLRQSLLVDAVATDMLCLLRCMAAVKAVTETRMTMLYLRVGVQCYTLLFFETFFDYVYQCLLQALRLGKLVVCLCMEHDMVTSTVSLLALSA